MPFNIVSFDNLTNQKILLKNNQLSLNDIEETKETNNFQEIKVFRKFTDYIPYLLDTNVQINFSGKNKDFDLGTVLPKDFNLSQINSDLKITYKNSHYFITFTSGTYFINFKSFANKEISEISIKNLINDSESEVWSIEKNNNVRNMDVSSASLVDPKQSNVPNEWVHLPAYNIKDNIVFKTTQQGLSYNTDLKINAERTSIFGFNDNIYSKDSVTLTNQNTKQLKFTPDLNLQSISLNSPKMIFKENNQNYVLLSAQDKKGEISFDTNKNEDIPSQLSDSYYVDSWTTYFTPRTELLWTTNAKVQSDNFWFNSWNLYSLFSLSILIISIYKLLGKESATLALFSLLSFYSINSSFWLFWIFLIITFSANKFLPQKYISLKNNLNTFNLLGIILISLFTIRFVFNEIFSIIHPNLSRTISFDGLSNLLYILIFVLLFKFLIKMKNKASSNASNRKWSTVIFFASIGMVLLTLPYLYSISSSTVSGYGVSVNKTGIGIGTLRCVDCDNPSQSPFAAAIEQDVIEEKTLSSQISSLNSAKLVAPKKIMRDIASEKTQVGHPMINLNTFHFYDIKSNNKEPVHFIIANKWLVDLYGLLQCIFLVLLSYIFIIYNILLFKKGDLLTKLPSPFYNNYIVTKIQSKINEA